MTSKPEQDFLVHDIFELLFPSHCLSCSKVGTAVCAACDSKIIRHLSPRYLDEVPLWPGAYYGTELAQVILMAKEQNNTAARNFLAGLLVEAFMRINRDSTIAGPILLVPIPSSKKANRARGYRHSYLLAKELANQLGRLAPHKVLAKDLLRTNRVVADQSALNRQERQANMNGAYSLVRDAAEFRQLFGMGQLYLVDDLVTSGSSLREGIRALKAGGFTPNGVLLAGVST